MKKIVIVDDSETIATIIKRVLERQGYAVHAALDSTAVFNEQVLDFGPDLFILDINMPKADGFSILENIRRMPRLRQVKVVMCSTKFFEHDIERARELGADSFLVKPFSESELIDTVVSVLA